MQVSWLRHHVFLVQTFTWHLNGFGIAPHLKISCSRSSLLIVLLLIEFVNPTIKLIDFAGIVFLFSSQSPSMTVCHDHSTHFRKHCDLAEVFSDFPVCGINPSWNTKHFNFFGYENAYYTSINNMLNLNSLGPDKKHSQLHRTLFWQLLTLAI